MKRIGRAFVYCFNSAIGLLCLAAVIWCLHKWHLIRQEKKNDFIDECRKQGISEHFCKRLTEALN